jgi:hypothetical protein
MDFFRVPSGVKAWFLPLAFAVGATLVIAGCGGGTSTAPIVIATPVPPPTPPPIPNSTPFSVASTQAIVASATSTPVVIAQPTAAGVGGTVTLPVTSVPPGTSVTTTVSSSPPPGLPPLAFGRQPVSVERTTQAGNYTVIFYVCYNSSNSMTGSGNPVFVETIPSGYPTTGVDYYYAIYQNSAWAFGYAGPGVISGQQVTLTGSYPITLTAQVQQCFAFYEQSSAAPTPTPPPSPAPTPTGAIGIGIH